MLLNRTFLTGAALAVVLATLLVPRAARATGEWDRNGFDFDDLDALERRHPGLRALFLRGEADLRAGLVQTAASSFEKVAHDAPENALANRRHCQALTELGKRQDALLACQASLQRKLTAPGFRALVGALMSGPATPEELVLATRLAEAAKKRMSDQPWSLAAISDIAERTGDQEMLENTVTELERIAPDHYETVRARRALNGFRLSSFAWGAWLALAVVVLGTLAHAARAALRAVRPRRRSATAATALLVALCAALHAHPASADDAPVAEPPAGGLSKWPINDVDPKQSLPTSEERDHNPLEFGYHMMDLADKADVARRKGDFLAVGKYYEAMAVAVPDRSIGYRKSCEGYEKANQLEKARAMCRGALGAEGVELQDYARFAKLLFEKPAPLSAADAEDLTEIATHLKATAGGMAAGIGIQCELAERLDDLKRLEDCVTLASQETPNDPKLLVYQWGIAMKREDYAHAQELIAAARKKALLPAGIEMMERVTREQSALGRRLSRLLAKNALPFGVAAGVLTALALGVLARRRLKLQFVRGAH